MQSQEEAIASTRESFSASSPQNDVDPDCQPSKIRRTNPSIDSSSSSLESQSVTSKAVEHSRRLRLDDSFTNIFGFSPNEFLPIEGRRYLVPESLDPCIATTLHDDALGKCIFSGFLDSSEIQRLAEISPFFQKLAAQHVTRLDLSRCPDLQVEDVMSLVHRFPNLKVGQLLAILRMLPNISKFSLWLILFVLFLFPSFLCFTLGFEL